MNRFGALSPNKQAMVVAIALVIASFFVSVAYRLIQARSLLASASSESLASSCVPKEKSGKIYFVSCGGTF